MHLVNRRGEPVHGQPTVASLRDIGEPVDLAYVLTGPASLPSIMADAAVAGVRNLVVIAAGFGEMGDEGHERERAAGRAGPRLRPAHPRAEQPRLHQHA